MSDELTAEKHFENYDGPGPWNDYPDVNPENIDDYLCELDWIEEAEIDNTKGFLAWHGDWEENYEIKEGLAEVIRWMEIPK